MYGVVSYQAMVISLGLFIQNIYSSYVLKYSNIWACLQVFVF